MVSDDASSRLGWATEKGPERERNADALAAIVFHGRLTAALVDGAGRKPAAAELAPLAAETAARAAARETPVLGVVTAARMCADPSVAIPAPSGAIVVATPQDGLKWRIAWAGDSTAWVLRNNTLKRVTTPHTEGEELRKEGISEDEARRQDNKLTNSLSRVPVQGVEGVVTAGDILILASDGLGAPARLSVDTFQSLVLDYRDRPQECANALVEAARNAGSQDDTTIAVIPHPETMDGGDQK